ncbi:MAG: RagB/SusD family nutrient uptake outer membrane protein [Bacteroidales bacterium]|nr:RagB/SusD family nutrient uptake outer membrane protein [Bacteroidales bacterium]
MKKIAKIALGIAGVALLATSCTKILEEHPKTRYTPDFFTTSMGVEGGLTALYAQLRYLYGNGYYYNILTTGTDEATWGQSADGNFKDADMSDAGTLNASTSRSDNLWNNAFTYINTASGIIENAENVGLDKAMIAEARFFRAFDYFQLVQTFGGVPLDLGAGELAFNSKPVRESVRNTVPEVYTKAVFPDLKTAMNDLPVNPRLTGTLTQNVARLYLAKAYLTYAWWLENPKGIPTYPECSRSDPDGHDAKWYFQQAYDLSLQAIANPGPYGLMDHFYEVSDGAHDRNKEILLYADHTENSEQYNGSSLSYSGGGSMDNFAGWMMNWNYPNMQATANTGARINPVLRTDQQYCGRPWSRMAPTQEAIATFIDRDKDSRYDGTFVYVFRTNWDRGGNPATYVEGPNGAQIGKNEAFLVYLDEEDASVNYSYNAGISMLGESPNYDYYVVNPSGVSRLMYPKIWKLGPYRTNTSGTGSPNAAHTRPFNIAKFSEFYFIAAEAAIKGASGSQSARDLINVLRARAGKWSYSVNWDREVDADYSADLVAATPAEITIDYLLDERMREYFGDGFRWFDLVRTQTWAERAKTYTICGPGAADHTPATVTRNIQNFHYLRPIPQGQLDNMKMDDAEKAAYQNPGYPVD